MMLVATHNRRVRSVLFAVSVLVALLSAAQYTEAGKTAVVFSGGGKRSSCSLEKQSDLLLLILVVCLFLQV